jgi:hypothetical protein
VKFRYQLTRLALAATSEMLVDRTLIVGERLAHRRHQEDAMRLQRFTWKDMAAQFVVCEKLS